MKIWLSVYLEDFVIRPLIKLELWLSGAKWSRITVCREGHEVECAEWQRRTNKSSVGNVITIEEFNQLCDVSLQKLSAIEQRMIKQEQRLDKAFKQYEDAVKECVK